MTDMLLALETLGGTTALGLTYYGIASYGFGARYWMLKDPDQRRAHRDAAHIRRTWPRLARYLGLALRDDIPTVRQALTSDTNRNPQPRIRIPRILAVETDSFGVTVDFKPLPNVGIKEFVAKCEHMANHWNMVRVAAYQVEPQRIRVRAVRRDPLTIPLAMSEPSVEPRLDYYTAGVDDFGQPARIRIKNGSGIGVYGLPTYGKTSFILGLIARLSLSPAVQFVICDGKVETGFEGDYMDVAERAVAVIGDDIEKFNLLMKELHKVRRARASTIRQTFGTANIWNVGGPRPGWPLIVIIIDEAHTYFEQVKATSKNADLARQNALAAENAYLVADLVRKCRSVGMLPIIATQKGTADAIPTNIRDNCHASVCFAVKTNAAAEAALGEAIKEHPEANPVEYQPEEYIGVASMVAERRKGFTRFRSPLCREAVAAATTDRTKHLASMRDVPGLTVGQDHRHTLDSSWDTPIAELMDGVTDDKS
ncbi:hypothetical protein [Nocardia testacea]|uniref:hypothetical protein n=1 Tax=Nocardia testacea TaxID=248551 RepID=UPI0034112BEC